MRLLTLAMGALGLAGFTVGVATPPVSTMIPPPASCSFSPRPSTSHFVSVPSSRHHVPSSIVKKEVSTSSYDLAASVSIQVVSSSTPTTSLSRWYREPNPVAPTHGFPTRSIPNITPTARSASCTSRGSLTLPLTTTCTASSATSLGTGWKDVCTEPAATTSDPACPCSASYYYYYTCSSSQDWGGRRSRWVAQVAAQSSQDMGGRHSRYAAQVAARTTQDLEGRSQRAAAHFAEATVTPTSTLAAADAVPTCTFDVKKGEYICPYSPPICKFDDKKGEYVCPTPKVARAAATPVGAPCPEGVEMCIPHLEVS
jgi:hypothetical protein